MLWWLAIAAAGDGVAIQAGSYEPLYPVDPAVPRTFVSSFILDATPVTRADFSAFVAENERWQRERVPAVLADPGYLASWSGPTEPPAPLDTPVTEVSWFAARAYCEWRGARLPTEDEWEYVSRASEDSLDASKDDAWLARTLAWYGSPRTAGSGRVGQHAPNAHGVHDMHGLVWEWVEDFNNTLFGTDVREGGDAETLRFCGSGTLSATDVSDYATFMRIAYRSSLQGKYTTRGMGFRCAADQESP